MIRRRFVSRLTALLALSLIPSMSAAQPRRRRVRRPVRRARRRIRRRVRRRHRRRVAFRVVRGRRRWIVPVGLAVGWELVHADRVVVVKQIEVVELDGDETEVAVVRAIDAQPDEKDEEITLLREDTEENAVEFDGSVLPDDDEETPGVEAEIEETVEGEEVDEGSDEGDGGGEHGDEDTGDANDRGETDELAGDDDEELEPANARRRRNAPERLAPPLLLVLVLVGCGGTAREPDAEMWNGEIETHGALRAMFHEGKTGSMVALDALLPDPHLYAVGALAGLAGEVTIVGGAAHLSFPAGASSRTETSTTSAERATLLVAARVPAWRTFQIERAVAFEELDEAIAALGVRAGFREGERFPFLVEGEVEHLVWHVIDGTRLVEGGTSHEDHLAAAVTDERERATATLVGFFSRRDRGVFTHHDSFTHIHCALDDPVSAGHVDHVVLPAGTVVKLPVRALDDG